MKEQAECPVDDIVLDLGTRWEYYQLKADKAVTWGESRGYLRNRFLEQSRLCQQQGQDYRLFVVVADADRKKSLEGDLGDEGGSRALRSFTRIILFPRLQRVAQLTRLTDELKIDWSEIAASRLSGNAEWEDLAEAFHSARVNCTPGKDGFVTLADVVDKIRSQGWARIYTPWDEALQDWSTFLEVLSLLDRFEFWVDRGYFEWRYGSAEFGMFKEPCNSDSFARFVRRVVEERPSTFLELEAHLP